MAEKFIPSENPTLSLSVNQDNELVAPTAEELLSANPALGILQERTQNMSASPSGTSIEKGLTVSGNLQFSDSISNKPTEIVAPNTVQVKGTLFNILIRQISPTELGQWIYTLEMKSLLMSKGLKIRVAQRVISIMRA